MTYRLAAHSTSDDPTGYRSREEEDKWRAKDPIARMANYLSSKGWFDEKENSARVEKARQDVLAALKSCEKTDICPIDDIIDDVYDTPPWHLKEQLTSLKAHIKKYPQMYPKTAGRVK